MLNKFQFSSVQSISPVWLFATAWTAARQLPCPSPFPGTYLNSCPSSQWCHSSHPLSSPSLPPSIFLSISVFWNESALWIRWPKYWSFSFSISPSNENSGMITFRTDWFDLLAVQGILRCLLQYYSLKASILWYSAFFGEGNGTPLQYSCLENPMDGGAWWAAAHGVVKSLTWLSDFPFTSHFHVLEKEMAAHPSVLAWRIPGTGEPGRLPCSDFGGPQNKVSPCFHCFPIYLP